MDISVRTLRCLLVLAEELHFGRAAARLHLTSPALSQQVARAERELGFTVFARSSRRVEVTDRGAEFLPLAQDVVDAADRLDRWHAALPSRDRRLRVGFMAAGAGPLFGTILAEARHRLPDVEIELHHLEWAEQVSALHANEVDVVFLREPFPGIGLHRTSVLDEQRVAVLPRVHPLANREQIPFAAIADEVFLRSASGPVEWTDFWMVNPRPDGSRARTGPAVSTVEEMLELCAAGLGITTTPASLTQFYNHPGVAFVPVADIPPSRVTLCSLESTTDSVVLRFRDLVRQLTLQQR